MRRYGCLFDQVCSFESLIKAATQASKGKKKKAHVGRYIQDLENEVVDLEEKLREKTYQPLPYRTFMIYDPKERMICASDFSDRVVHHAVCKVLEPIFEQTLIYDSYACRKDKGTHRAIKRAQEFSRRYAYFLKLDVLKFYDSVDHGVLKSQLCKKIKDVDMIWLLYKIIDHPVPWTQDGKGIPIGNLTSQHFANYYLSGLDHFVKEYLRIGGYIRYMDDFVLFADEKSTLWDAIKRIEDYLREKCKLQTKFSAQSIAPVFQGLPFLGFRIFPGIVRIDRRGWRRFRRKVIQRDKELITGYIDHETWTHSMSSLIGHLKQAKSRNLRAPFFKRPGANEAPTV